MKLLFLFLYQSQSKWKWKWSWMSITITLNVERQRHLDLLSSEFARNEKDYSTVSFELGWYLHLHFFVRKTKRKKYSLIVATASTLNALRWNDTLNLDCLHVFSASDEIEREDILIWRRTGTALHIIVHHRSTAHTRTRLRTHVNPMEFHLRIGEFSVQAHTSHGWTVYRNHGIERADWAIWTNIGKVHKNVTRIVSSTQIQNLLRCASRRSSDCRVTGRVRRYNGRVSSCFYGGQGGGGGGAGIDFNFLKRNQMANNNKNNDYQQKEKRKEN